jgi:hypothetical protein
MKSYIYINPILEIINISFTVICKFEKHINFINRKILIVSHITQFTIEAQGANTTSKP